MLTKLREKWIAKKSVSRYLFENQKILKVKTAIKGKETEYKNLEHLRKLIVSIIGELWFELIRSLIKMKKIVIFFKDWLITTRFIFGLKQFKIGPKPALLLLSVH